MTLCFARVAVGYRAAHLRVERLAGPATRYRCVDCHRPAREWSLNHGARYVLVDDQGRAYYDDPGDYAARCTPCHRRYDRRTPTRQVSLLGGDP